MTAKHSMTRRNFALSAAAVPAVAALPGPLMAAAEMMGAGIGPWSRFKLGGFEVTTLLAGTRPQAEPHKIFGLNATPEQFAAAAAVANIPADRGQNFFTPTLVNTGSELVLFDTGLNAAGTEAALNAAGYQASQVDIVVITHMHGDHIGGLMKDGAPTFSNARYVTGAAEFNNWSAANNQGFNNNVRPLAEKMTMIDDGASVVSGITSMAMPGHTPGHMGYVIESNGRRVVLIADACNHFAWSLPHPEWEVSFDVDKPLAAATRRRILGMIATDGIPFVGYHMPFPAIGFVETAGDGFRYVPASYQHLLE